MPSRKDLKLEHPPLRLLLWTALAGVLFGLLGMGELPEDMLRTARNSLHTHKASGDIVLVKIDDKSLRDIGRWPWPRRYHGQLTDELTKAGADRIFFDVTFFGPSERTDDKLFAEALERSNRVVIGTRTRHGPSKGTDHETAPLPMFTERAQVATISWQYNYQNAVWRLPYSLDWRGSRLPSIASLLADRPGATSAWFIPDYSLDLQTIPNLSAVDVLKGKIEPGALHGKNVIIGTTSPIAGDQYFVPGIGQMGGVYVHIVGAETLKRGDPLYLGWMPAFLIALGAVALATLRSRRLHRTAILVTSAVTLAVGPAALEAKQLHLDVMPALFVVVTVAIALTWRGFRQRGLLNPTSGLPNMDALRASKNARKKAIVVAKILNHAEMIAALPNDCEGQLIDQIKARLSVGSNDRILYHGDAGTFAWTEDAQAPFGNHLEALYALFRTPARVAGLSLDMSVAFGVEIGSSRSVANRIASAFVAAEEAAHDGLKWKYHEPESLQDASWKLSILSQLDAAIDKGEVWVAFQPKLDLATQRIVGAEALARWTHPEKGPIAASEFVSAAELHDRIGKLTDFVLEKALAAGALINRRQPGFSMAVNLSARLLSDTGFPLRLRAMLARHGLDPGNLTLELTETAALAGTGAATEMLVALRELGVEISIDDYGTGLSTLEYLKKIPAGELKIDQSFVKSMLDNRSDRLMVQSTIALAHSLGRRVVAEGVEQREVLTALAEMQCDFAQGFIVGRPMSLESLQKRVAAPKRTRVA